MKFLNFVKNHKILTITVAFFIVFFITVFMLLKAFFPSGNVYGNRLKGIDKVAISEKEKKEWTEKIKDRSKIKNVSLNIEGRLINILIDVDDDASLGDMKDYLKERLEIFGEEELKYYDFQFYLNTEKETEDFPAIGYKHKTQEDITW